MALLELTCQHFSIEDSQRRGFNKIQRSVGNTTGFRGESFEEHGVRWYRGQVAIESRTLDDRKADEALYNCQPRSAAQSETE